MKRKVLAFFLMMSVVLLPVLANASAGADIFDGSFSYSFHNPGVTVSCTWSHTVSYSYTTDYLYFGNSWITVKTTSNCNTSISNGSTYWYSAKKFRRSDFVVLKTYDNSQWATGSAKTTVELTTSGSIVISHNQSIQQTKNVY